MKSFVKFRPKQSRRRQTRLISPWWSALERLENRVLLTDPTISAPSPQMTAEDTAKVISGLSFADDAVDTIEVTVTLDVTNGTLFVSGNVPGGVTSTDITGNGTGTVMITALQAALNATLADAAGLTFTPTTDFNGSDTLAISINDNENGNAGTPLSASTNVSLNVTAVNDAPSFTIASNPPGIVEDAGLQTVASFATAIAEGPGNESSQTVTNFTVTSVASTGGLTFVIAPSIDAVTGALSYQSAANSNGTATFNVTLTDNGSGTAPNVNTSAVQTLIISVAAVNDAPSFTKGPNQTVLEDAGEQSVSGWATNITAGTNEPGQTVTFTVVADTPALFSVQPVVSSTGVLTYTPAPNANGLATVTVTANDGLASSAAQTFTITITEANVAPTVANVIADQTGAFMTPFQFTVPSNTFTDAGDTLTLSATGRPAWLMFTSGAASANPTGTFTGTPTATDVGSFNITVTATDSTGATVSDTFKITIPGNAVPSFTKGANQTVLEDSIAQTVTNWATNISQGLNESGQTVNFVVSNDNPGLFSAQPAISATGELTFTPAANANGMITVTVFLHDDAGTASGGVDTTASQTFTITLIAVNDVPRFAFPLGNQTVLEDSGAQTVTGFVSGINVGGNDSGQSVDFLVSNSNGALFSNQPTISASGTLTYTPAANANGSATVMVFIHDNGGTANDGVDTSLVAQTFTITVTPVSEAPTVANPIADQTAPLGEAFTFDIPLNTFADPDNDPLTLTATGVPSWLTFTPATRRFSGTPTATDPTPSTITVTATDGTSSVNDTFIITVLPNSAPSFTKGANQTVLEDAGPKSVPNWATNISAGLREPSQTAGLVFIVNTDNLSLFRAAPTIASNGTLAYTPADNANGTATVTVRLRDTGGTANGGVESSADQTFTITVTSVNDAPSFGLPADPDPTVLNVLINSPAQTYLNFVNPFAAGPNETQTVDFIVSNNKQGLFTVQPAIAANGTLTFTPAAGAFGTATVTVQIHDNGGIANGGDDTSDPQTFTINIGAFNKGTPVSKANPEYRPPAGAKVRAFVVDGELIVQFNGVPQQFYEPGLIQTLTILGGSKNDEINLSGLDETAYANLSSVVIRTLGGNDRIVGSFAIDSIDGGAGNDTLTGGENDDTLIGNAGTDLLVETATADLTLENSAMTGLGADTLFTIENASLTADDAGRTIDASLFTRGVVTLTGGAGNDVLSGGSKNDSITGRDGDDILAGGVGNDTVLGGFGNDILNGDAGSDLLIGGFDDDTLDGGIGPGRDTVAGGNGGAARGGDGVADAGDMIMNSEVISEVFKKLFAFE